MNSYPIAPDKILNVAHRGGESHAPENTFAAFDNVPSLGTNWVESDLRISADGEVVLIHDATVDRTTDGTGAVCEMTVAELEILDAGSWFSPQYTGQRIPTLSEFFQRYKGHLKSMMEIKDAGHVEERLVELIAKDDLYGEVVIIGFDRESLERVKSLDERVAVGWTALDPTDANVDAAIAMGCHHIGIGHKRITAEVVAHINGRGMPVRSTNVPDVETMRHVVASGVMGMTINFPEHLTELVRQLSQDSES